MSDRPGEAPDGQDPPPPPGPPPAAGEEAAEPPVPEPATPEAAPAELEVFSGRPPPAARATPVQLAAPQDWPLARTPMRIGRAPPEPALPPPEPPVAAPPPAARPRRRRSWPARIALWGMRAFALFVIGSVLWVGVYRFVAPPITFTMVGDMIGGHGVTRRWMPLSRIDPNMGRAAIAAEDGNFCLHNGFDFEALAKAFARNAQGGRIRGGSTISQQTAKNVFLWQGGGYFRKGLEAWFTFLIETIWGKRRIMEVYLNVAETGIGTYGVNAGAMRYFRHDASRLSEREAAQIAAVLPLPKRRAGAAPKGFTRRYGATIDARIDVVRGSGYDACLR